MLFVCQRFWLCSPGLTLPGDVSSIPTFTKTKPLKAEHDGGVCPLPVCFQSRTMIGPFQLGVVLQDVHHQMSHNLDLSVCTWRCREESWEESHQIKKAGQKRVGHSLARWRKEHTWAILPYIPCWDTTILNLLHGQYIWMLVKADCSEKWSWGKTKSLKCFFVFRLLQASVTYSVTDGVVLYQVLKVKMKVLGVTVVLFLERYFMAGAIINVHSQIFLTSFVILQCCSSHYNKNGDLVNCGTTSGRRVPYLWRLSLGPTLDCEHGNTGEKHVRKVSALQSYSNKSPSREAQLSDSTAAVPG